MLAALRADLRAARERDPAARSTVELVLCYPGVHAIWGHRASHWLWRHGRTLLARLCSAFTQRLTGVDIHPAAVLGPGLFIDHAVGVVIGETAEVGADVTIYHGVTLGGTSLEHGKRHPTVGDRVTIGAGARCRARSRSATTAGSARTPSWSSPCRRTRSWSACPAR